MEIIEHEYENKILEDISTYSNLNSNQKMRWIGKYPEKIPEMLNYLINITKDR